ncbi:uncharacterized protein [Periplaneta americana]|uniref:uncharacterized protein isoform X7 n=1 Tax=Periplaneta americana TaxID=6978 RepID=UPI0037E9C5EF
MKYLLKAMMDAIKMGREIDTLALEGSNNTDIEEEKLEEGKILDLQVTGIKTGCMDHSTDVKSEMTFDKTYMPIDISFVKSEVEEENEAEIKTESMDHSCGLKSEISHDDSPVPIDFPIMKREVEEGNVLDLDMTDIRTEYVDHSYDLKSEMTFEASPVPIDFPIMKSEAELFLADSFAGRGM